ncbi:nucleoside deaminase [Roseiconus lacunae]|uniref:Nucleoside deaminase n=1 Tax=Roseiconus lacunae TaxID=2605694 RepID=A0ABT7PD47_9BACT|nr:nucleoside deaminase [Roseiconus lacunae]MCD0459705.1 nucleoside deaminase [Roseiconus lacunae]MDM4014403.1 nucleoside deaminase [Roseiconus lacunae]WRQ49716.1 nucleoside deaminase [Stieleria sp. HD01]
MSPPQETSEQRMDLAIKIAEVGISLGQSPFGAAIFDDRGTPIAITHNVVKSNTDPSAHAEVIAIRTACAKLGQANLRGYQLVSTCEPCPMCAATIVFSGIRSIVFGASVEDAKKAGFDELQLASKLIFDEASEPIEVYGGVQIERCVRLFKQSRR